MALSYGLCVLFLNSTALSRYLHATVCTFSSLLLTAAQESMACIHCILFIRSPEARDLDGLHLPSPADGATCHHEHPSTRALVGPGPGFLRFVAGSGTAGSQNTGRGIAWRSSDYSPE